MPAASPQILERLENSPKSIRNVCILAHIDHGKTSLSDCLLASNGVISQQHQGEIRYLDSRPDEQERGITMEASAISLYFRTAEQEFLMNLIDSPGHVDFCSEVTQASRLCDAAIILVDALEGVCSQTVSALKQAWDEELQSILVINKVDKLYEDWRLNASEAANHLSRVVEQVNAVWGQFYVGKRMETEEDNDDVVYFSPSNNNVVFCSALQGWGFTIQQFAAIYEKKLGVDRKKLVKFLWGDFFLDPKTKKVVPRSGGAGAKRKNMFTQFVMDNIWAIYTAVEDEDNWKIDKIVSALQLPKPVQNYKDVREVFHQWIPISRAILSGVTMLPSPLEAQARHTKAIVKNTPSFELIDPDLRRTMEAADSEGAPLAYISKVVSVPESELPSLTRSGGVNDKLAALRLQGERLAMADADEDTNVLLLGFARIFSGTFTAGMELDLLGPRHDPASPDNYREPVKIGSIYIFMGRDLVPITKAGPGAIVAFSGLDGKIHKSGTLAKRGVRAPNLARSAQVAAPILRVAVEPKDPTQLDRVEHGLEMLNTADPSVDFEISALGEFILATSGELHLERCLTDLANRYAKVELDVSPPVVPFRETILPPFSGEGPIEVDVGGIHLVLSTKPLGQQPETSPRQAAVFRDNILIDETPTDVLLGDGFGAQSILTGFREAMLRGPLIEEPVRQVCVTLENLTCNLALKSGSSAAILAQRRLISATKRAIYESLKQWSPRIMLATYLCEIQASTEVLGRVYGVITRRKGKVLTEELKEGTPFFLIKAQIPVVESIGFSEEIRKKTSGAANPQLVFSGFELLDEDPYWVPATEEELEFLGETADRENGALAYVNQIRRRKGLAVAEKLVDGAERDRARRH